MSSDKDPARDHGDEQESWQDLFGSVFELADEVTSRMSAEDVEERLKRTLRKVTPRVGVGAEMASPETVPPSAAVAARGPAPADLVPAGKPGSVLCLSLGGRSFTVTLDRTVERSSADSRTWTRWRKPIRFPGRPPRWGPTAHRGSFWRELDEAGQEMFAGLAWEQAFAPGTVLMREGETADHIVVILEGRTEVSIRDGAGQRVVAHRGPGDLIGEGAALQVRVRSATVVAAGTVRALVMRSQDFATFISACPEVSGFVEKLIRDRQAVEPAGPEAAMLWYQGADDDPQRPGREPEPRAGARPTVVATSMLEFGRLLRSAGDRHIMHDAMVKMTHSALTGMSDGCLFEARDDGMLVVIPPAVPTSAIMTRLTETLPAALRLHNRLYNMCAQIQLRIAVDTGSAERADQATGRIGLYGAGELLEVPALVEAISSRRANLGMIVSSSVYETAIRPFGGPVEYEPIRIEGRGRPEQAWMQLIDPVPDRLPMTA
jgi:hypothetical protein